mgnify:CR=1 FL=1
MPENNLNLPKTAFSMKANLPSKEPKILESWEETKLYERLRKKSAGKEKFILHDGPPYANGHIHMGTALNKILKDIVTKSHQMNDKDSVYVPGWDCHGLPIEWKIEEEYKKKKKNKDEVPTKEFRKECREFAEKWIHIHKKEFKRLGVIGDWENYYSTMSFDAEAQIVRELGKFLLEGSLYRGFKPVLWSTVEKTALADAEVEYKDHKSNTIYAVFQIKKSDKDFLKDASIIIWTTTPWTIPANKALAYNKDINYSILELDNKKIVIAEKLINSGSAYWCNCTPEELDEMRKAQSAAGKKPMYDGRSRNLGLARSSETVLRLATPENGETIVNDLIRGEIKFNNNELDDLILLRSDGSPTYHFCNVVDDYEQRITTVIRGEDHISNTPRQIHIQNALGYPELEYAHLPLVLGTDKKRLSKRNAATSLEEYREKGYLDSAILNTLARLGWSQGENDVFYMNDLIKEFNIKDVQKAGAIFDITKLDWLNSQHLANLSLESFKEQLQPFLQALEINIEDHEKSDQLIEAMRTSDNTFSGIAKSLIPYYKDINEYDEKAIEKFISDKSILEELKVLLNGLDDWNQDNIDNILKNYQSEKGLSVPAVNQPIRISLTGSTKSPGLGLTLFLFGKNKSLERISNLLSYLS